MRWPGTGEPMTSLNQVVHVTLINLRTIPQRLGTSLVIVIGIAGVVGVLVSVLAMGEGFRHTLASTGRATRVIMLRAGSDAEMTSGVARDQATVLANLPGVARDATGRPLVSAELVVMVDLPRHGQSDPNNVPFRGVQPIVFAVRDEVRVVEGRPFERGLREVIVGRKAARTFAGLADPSAAGLAALKESIARDRRLSINVLREPEYYAKQASILSRLIGVLGYSVAMFMAIGATFGALNCMYSAIASRQTEIATLRAIGFGGAPVVASVMVEAILLALLGGVAGAALAYVYCDGASLSTLNFNTFSQVAFDFRVTRGLVAQGLAGALVIGAAGGLLPAIRAARLPVTAALRTG